MSDVANQMADKFALQQEVKKLNAQLNKMKNVSTKQLKPTVNNSNWPFLLQIIIEKDSKIKQQGDEITNLRKKNYEFRSKYQEL